MGKMTLFFCFFKNTVLSTDGVEILAHRCKHLMKQAGILPVRAPKFCTRRAQCAADI